VHFITFVLTEEKPTQEVLAKALEPFRETPENRYSHWDWFALGGCFAGLLIPHNIKSTLSAGAASEPGEAYLRWRSEESQYTDPGVDALQCGNLAEYPTPDAVVVDGEWYEPEARLIALRMHELGIDLGTLMSAEELAAAHELTQQWAEDVKGLIGATGRQCWLSIVDCHI
jgi:hypothetical protein